MTIPCLVQSSLDPLAAKFSGHGVIGIVSRQAIAIKKTGFGSITFFLLNVVNSHPFAEAFQLVFQGKDRNLGKVLIVAGTHIDCLLESRVVSHNYRPDLTLNTEINNVTGCFIQVIFDLIRAAIRKPRFLLSEAIDFLLVFMVFQVIQPFIEPLVNRFEPFPVNQKRFTSSADDSAKIIKSKVNPKV